MKIDESNEQFEKRIDSLEAFRETIRQFLCESQSLRTDLQKFEEDPHCDKHKNPNYDFDCRCESINTRLSVLYDREHFYGFLNEQEPIKVDCHDWMRDTEHETYRKILYEEILPLFERMHTIEPEKVTRSHIQWLKNTERHQFSFYRYMDWLIPELRKGFFSNLDNPQSLQILDELESRFRPDARLEALIHQRAWGKGEKKS